ncbi:ABC transporter permease [Allopusillimonas ginsengisoli]|uniref:ABC transporter permease n=1 Tax=Allopusillimonas ginsengisoli TaxID=453575 RepID=UPI00101EA421|nr:ABC transporter permease [Allopusillimonas ginsengisoli]TEA79658.1 ABC transporter permease [Allopusillimonas ginsengisoli]
MDNKWIFSITIFVCCFLLTPVFFIIFYSFVSSVYFSWPAEWPSLKWYVRLYENDGFRQAFRTSITMTAIVTPVSLLLAIPTSIALTRFNFFGRDTINNLLMSPLLVPGVVTGVVILSFGSARGLTGGYFLLVVGMVIFTFPFALRALISTFRSINSDIEECARTLGASEWQIFSSVTLQQLKPGLLAGSIFVFTQAFDNFAITAFLAGAGHTTIPVETFQYIRDFDDPTVAALSGVLILMTVILTYFIEKTLGIDKFLRLDG